MGEKIGGTRIRPRVALIGTFADNIIEKLTHLFPTLWCAPNFMKLETLVHSSEIDLVIIGSNVGNKNNNKNADDYIQASHVISFSPDISLPGPIMFSYLNANSIAETEEFLLPGLSLPLYRQREVDLQQVKDIRGWRQINNWSSSYDSDRDKKIKAIREAGIIVERFSDIPLAVIFVRQYNNLGIAWLPNTVFNQAAWVELIALIWAESDRERFTSFGDWTRDPEWIVPEEEEIVERVKFIEAEKHKLVEQIDKELAELSLALAEKRLEVNQGRRRLITAQGDDLVQEVSEVFKEIGFDVEILDQELASNQSRREDIRLRIPRKSDWEAIVEVRGYARSVGQTADLQRLGRFATLYNKEKGRFPAKKIYVVNSELELPPSRRQEPLAPAKEDVETFAEDGGLVISTLDLFKAMKIKDQSKPYQIRESILCTTGRWNIHALMDSNEGMA